MPTAREVPDTGTRASDLSKGSRGCRGCPRARSTGRKEPTPVGESKQRLLPAAEDGSGLEALEGAKGKLTKATALAVMGEKLWWADQGTDQIGTCDKKDGGNWRVLRNSTSPMMHMKIYNETVQTGANLCSHNNGDCSQLCLPTSPSTRACMCTAGYSLRSGQQSCEGTLTHAHTALAVMGAPDQIGTCDKKDGGNWRVLRNSTSPMMHMKIYNETVQTGANLCSHNNGDCSQLCLPTSPSTRACMCTAGYSLRSGQQSCEGVGSFLLYSVHEGIRGIPLDPLDKSDALVPVSGTSLAVGIDFHADNDTIYWVDMGLSTISRAKRDQTWREDVVTNGRGLGQLALGALQSLQPRAIQPAAVDAAVARADPVQLLRVKVKSQTWMDRRTDGRMLVQKRFRDTQSTASPWALGRSGNTAAAPHTTVSTPVPLMKALLMLCVRTSDQ
ncbi:hypothetical protein CRUP_036392 [Coryphaenoides rupestris]|nr:hypothetical protein CRUP_036392 [Coryphaenoides rupestris]